MSDRSQQQLRGPVRQLAVETTYPGSITADGTQIPQRKALYTTEYSVEGHILAFRSRNSDGSEWITRYIYDASGRLLKTTSGNEGQATAETAYFYDERARLLKIEDSRKPNSPVTFRYDERGRKTKVQISRTEDFRPNLVEAGTPFQATDRAPNLPEGGSTTTLYDEHDRPIEVQVHDAQGALVKRAVCIYDALGRVSEERQILANPETLIPAEMRAEVLKSAGASLEELREQLRKLMGGRPGPFSIAYNYDAQGRVTQTRRQIFNQEAIIETTYNEHGDKAAEITRSEQIADEDEQSAPRAGLPSYSEIRYSYQYDDHGNWTEETVSYRFNPGDAFTSSTARSRKLIYY